MVPMHVPQILKNLDRRVSVAVKVGVPVVVISVFSSALFGAISVSEATKRVNEQYSSEARDLSRSVEKEASVRPDDIQSMSAFLTKLADTHPSVARVRAIKRDSRGAIVWASSEPGEVGVGFDASLPGPGESVRFDGTLDGRPVLVELDGTKNAGGIAAVASYFSLDPRNQAISSLTKRIVLESFAVLLFQLATLGLAMYLIVIRRVKRLNRAAAAVAEGDFTVRLPEGDEPPSADELMAVARQFDEMIRAIETRTLELQRSAEREHENSEQLRELDRVKNTLLHAVSHDLRGPITSVLGSAATLERADELGLSQQDRAELLGGLSAGARKMHALVSSLLDLDRLDRGIVTPKREITDLGALVERVVDELGFASDRTLHREIYHLEMAIDAPKIERIVENLLGNAVKHTPRGTEAWVKVEPFEAGALISVEDAGPGVPEELRESIFEPFKQGSADSPGGSGVGIGLSLVASFAELHGGRAWVGDRDGGGASFKVYIPDGEPEPDAAETVDGESHS